MVFAAPPLIRATPESTLSSSDFPSQVALRRTRRLPPLRSHPRPTPRTSPRQSVPARCGKSRCPAPGHAFPPPTNLAAATPFDPPPTARTRSTHFPFDCPPRPDPPRSASDVPAPSAPHLPATDMPSQALPIPIHPTPLAKGLADLLDLPELRRKLLNGAVLAGAAHGVAAAPGRVGMSPSSLVWMSRVGVAFCRYRSAAGSWSGRRHCSSTCPQSPIRTWIKRQRVAALCDVRTQKVMISVPDVIKCAVAVEGTLTT